MIRRPPRSTLSSSSAASDVYKRQYQRRVRGMEGSGWFAKLARGYNATGTVPPLAYTVDENQPTRGNSLFVRRVNPKRQAKRGEKLKDAPYEPTVPWVRFQEGKFHFGRVSRAEEIKDLVAPEGCRVLLNKFPMFRRHVLLTATEPQPQLITAASLAQLVRLFLVDCPQNWVGYFNGWSAGASVNHLHWHLSLIHISEPTRLLSISYAVFCLKKKKKKHNKQRKKKKSIKTE
eukprot:TRINITY_DN14261_c0_g1_i4.p1 TRINITY_DN14261_c0_g1~~TRINITY_DN14261_c0_g1_i4.p1  ORF type:complete len:232 (+),score=62.55 TRINITY_DN14261_c0_g1_i4:132-827(+)